MNQVANRGIVIPRMSEEAIANVRALEKVNLSLPQVHVATHHLIHAGMYHRTICIPKWGRLTGVFITIPTVLIVCGKAVAYADGEIIEIDGYAVIPASAGRKQAFVALEDTYLTMSFATKARTIEAAEDEFTNEAELLFSRNEDAENFVTITGE